MTATLAIDNFDPVATIPALLAALDEDSGRLRVNATAALLDVSDDEGGRKPLVAAVPRLAEALRDPEASVRNNAALVLGSIGPPARDALPKLRQALRDPVSRIRERAEEAIHRIEAEE